jgi:hypothetical protein
MGFKTSARVLEQYPNLLYINSVSTPLAPAAETLTLLSPYIQYMDDFHAVQQRGWNVHGVRSRHKCVAQVEVDFDIVV